MKQPKTAARYVVRQPVLWRKDARDAYLTLYAAHPRRVNRSPSLIAVMTFRQGEGARFSRRVARTLARAMGKGAVAVRLVPKGAK
jgi:hypothetical protein